MSGFGVGREWGQSGQTQREGPPEWSCAGVTKVCSRQALMVRGKDTFYIPHNKTPKPNRFYLVLIWAPISKDDLKKKKKHGIPVNLTHFTV